MKNSKLILMDKRITIRTYTLTLVLANRVSVGLVLALNNIELQPVESYTLGLIFLGLTLLTP